MQKNVGMSINSINLLYKNYKLGQFKKDNETNNDIYRNRIAQKIYNNKNIIIKKMKDVNELVKFFVKKKNNTIRDKMRNSERYNIIENKYKDLESRKIFNKLSLPHYYFTSRYNEKSMVSQIRH
jgi:hypothetical protein